MPYALRLFAAALATLIVGAEVSRAIVLNDGSVPAGGMPNYWDQTNIYSNVVSLNNGTAFSNCTGTLINSRTILTAAHCGNITAVSFSPNPFATPNPQVAVTRTIMNAAYDGASTTTKGADIALLSLASPVTNVTPVQLLTAAPGSASFPKVGDTVITVGYGLNGTGSNPNGNPDDGKRRFGTTSLGGYYPEYAVTSTGVNLNSSNPCTDDTNNCIRLKGTQQFFWAQFRNPISPNSPNLFNLTNGTTSLEAGPAPGDSGGPLFWCPLGNGKCTPSQLVELGEVQGGSNPSGTANGYGEVNAWTPVNIFADWIAQNNPLRFVTAASGNFNWSNAAAWVDSVPGTAATVPDNTVSKFYQVTLSNPGTMTLDMSPTVDSLLVAGDQSQLSLPTGFTLTTVVGTTLSAGTMTFSGGALASPTVALNGGVVQGNGTLTGTVDSGNVTAVTNTGSLVAPLGILIVQGSYTQTAGGALQFRAASGGTSDQLNVSGAATFGGTIRALVQPGLYGASTQYAGVVAMASSTGQFASALSSSPFFIATPTYNPASVDVTLTRRAFGAVPGLTANQQAVGNALERGYSTTLTGNAATLYANLLAATSTSTLTQLSGSGTGVTQTTSFATGSAFMTMMMEQGALGRSGEAGATGGAPLGYAASEPATAGHAAFAALKPPVSGAAPGKWRAWTAAFGTTRSQNNDDGSNTGQTIGGGAIGVERVLTPDLLLGFAVGASTGSFATGGTTSGSASAAHLGLYGIQSFGSAYLAGSLAYSRASNNTTRGISGIGPSETATGSFASDQLGGRIELGRRFAVADFGLTPYVAVQYATLWQRAYSESSTTAAGAPGVLALSFQSTSVSSLPAFLGLQIDQRLMLAGMLFSPFLRASWVHEFRPATRVSAGFLSVPGTAFTVDGPRAVENTLRLDAGATLAVTRTASLFARATGELSGRSQALSGTGGLKLAW